MLGNKIRRLRTEQGLTQRQLADKAGVTHSLVGHIETGRIRNPRIDTLLKLSLALGLPKGQVVSDSGRAA